MGKISEADNFFRAALSIDSPYPPIFHHYGLFLAKQNRYHDFVEQFDNALKLFDKFAPVYCDRGISLMELGRLDESLSSHNMAASLAPNIPTVFYNRANTLFKQRNFDSALRDYDKAITLDPNYFDAHCGRGNVFCELERHNDALAAYDKALALKPSFAEAWIGRGNVFCELGRHNDALAAYDKALTLKPSFAEAWIGRGGVFHKLKRHNDALAAYDKALALKPSFAEAWIGRGNVYSELRRYDEALAAHQKALASKPDLANAWLARGITLSLMGRADEAIADYRQALKLGGDFELLGYHLAALGAAASPPAMPAKMVGKLFNGYADSFDEHLVGTLRYQAPALLANLVKRFAPSATLDILDLGSGTGLVGKQLRPLARTLTGVDLSPNMLARAREGGIYDRLICSDINQFLQTPSAKFDLAVAADVFIYIGDLSSVFQGVRSVLRDGGLFCFSVEATSDCDFVLRSTLRYAHSMEYLQRLAGQCAFVLETVVSQAIRQEHGIDVDGYYAVMRC